MIGKWWSTMIHLHSWKETDGTSIPIHGAGSHPQIEDHGLSIEGVKSHPSPVEDHGPMKPAEPLFEPPIPLDNQPVHRKLVGYVKVQCQWADTSPHWKRINSLSTMWTEIPLKVKSMQLDTSNLQPVTEQIEKYALFHVHPVTNLTICISSI